MHFCLLQAHPESSLQGKYWAQPGWGKPRARVTSHRWEQRWKPQQLHWWLSPSVAQIPFPSARYNIPCSCTSQPSRAPEHPITQPVTGTKPQLWKESNKDLCDPQTITNSIAPREWKTGPKFISGLTAAKAVPFGSCYFCEMEDGKCKMETATISLMEITSEIRRKGVTDTHSCFRCNV